MFCSFSSVFQNSGMKSLSKPKTESQLNQENSVTHLCLINLKQLLVSFLIIYIGELDV